MISFAVCLMICLALRWFSADTARRDRLAESAQIADSRLTRRQRANDERAEKHSRLDKAQAFAVDFQKKKLIFCNILKAMVITMPD